MIIDGWHFEVVQVRCRKVEKYGDPYSAIVNITVTDGEAHIEGALSTTKPTRKDRIAMIKYLKRLGHNSYISSSYKNGKRTIKTTNL